MSNVFDRLDSLGARIDEVLQEKLELEARVAALESQLAVRDAIDPESHGVYREAAVMLATYVAGCRVDAPDARQRRFVRMWGPLADRVEEQLQKETEH